MEHKSSAGAIEIKSADQGTFSAVFATFGVIDKDGDVTAPGAFTDGAEVLVSAYQHKSWDGALPIGTATIRTTATEAIVDGKFFLDTAAGLETFKTLKNLGSRQEWSYGFDIEDATPAVVDGKDVRMLNRMKVHEVSPVLIGAGVNTRTLDIKSRKETDVTVESTYAAGIRPHETRTNAKRWDGKATRDALPAELTIDQLRAVHAHVKATGDPTALVSYGFLHHDGGGEANLRACLAGIAFVNGTKSGGMTPAERKSVYDHLAQHLDDGDRDVPNFKATASDEFRSDEEAADLMMRHQHLRERVAKDMAVQRAKGKAIKGSTVDILEWLYDEMKSLRSVLDSPQEDADREFARYIRSLHHPQE